MPLSALPRSVGPNDTLGSCDEKENKRQEDSRILPLSRKYPCRGTLNQADEHRAENCTQHTTDTTYYNAYYRNQEHAHTDGGGYPGAQPRKAGSYPSQCRADPDRDHEHSIDIDTHDNAQLTIIGHRLSNSTDRGPMPRDGYGRTDNHARGHCDDLQTRQPRAPERYSD